METISPYIFYQGIAALQKLEFADLREFPCDPELLSSNYRDEYIKNAAIPWKKTNSVVIIATSSITKQAQLWAEENYGNNYRFAITTPFDINHSVNSIFANENTADARDKLWITQPEHSAKSSLQRRNIYIFCGIILTIIPIVVKFPLASLASAFVVSGIFYFVTMLFKIFLMFFGYMAAANSQRICHKTSIADEDLPLYTILIPLYQETETLLTLVRSIEALDYPQSKLDIKFITEEDDHITINAIKALRVKYNFEIIKVPFSLPRTKPKACNYALRFARGEYVTIYDAEDTPEPDQLKKVLYKFENGGKELACVQARLNYFNRNENLLTRMFAIEYATLFDCTLFGLEKLGIPILLGGTSNHFRTQILRELNAWDPYNVTEDADLGIRIAKKGLHCSMVWSLTNEEAPISLWPWMKQRTRWIKGHMQTWLVHMRNPIKLYRKLGLVGFAGIQLFLGAPTVIFIISPIMWLVWALFMTGVFSLGAENPGWYSLMLKLSIFSLYTGICIQILFALAVIIKNKWQDMLLYSLIFPFYWILHCFVSFRALWQLIKCPHDWEKTTHGVTKFRNPKPPQDTNAKGF